jgi:hypothetical protein
MADNTDRENLEALAARAVSQPLVTHIYTADPSAHVFEGRVYIYPSHDIDAGIAHNDQGDQYAMEDYHVLRMDTPDGGAVDCGVALHVRDVPWAAKQMWAPDAACRDGRYYLYFPAKRADGVFQIGVAIGERPEGPFVPEPQPIAGSYSIDPGVLSDDDGAFYMVFGGIWGGQLQQYRGNVYSSANKEPAADEPALGPRIARLRDDMKQFDESPRETKQASHCSRATMSAGISKGRGCTSTAAATTCPIPRATRTFCVTRSATTRTVRSPIRGSC